MALVCPLLPTALLQVSHTVPCLLSQSVSSRHGASSPHVRSVSFSAALTKEQKTVVFFHSKHCFVLVFSVLVHTSHAASDCSV